MMGDRGGQILQGARPPPWAPCNAALQSVQPLVNRVLSSVRISAPAGKVKRGRRTGRCLARFDAMAVALGRARRRPSGTRPTATAASGWLPECSFVPAAIPPSTRPCRRRRRPQRRRMRGGITSGRTSTARSWRLPSRVCTALSWTRPRATRSAFSLAAQRGEPGRAVRSPTTARPDLRAPPCRTCSGSAGAAIATSTAARR